MLLGDAFTYDAWASRIASGEWISQEVFYQAPLYPYALGVLYATVGRDLFALRLVQAALGAAGCALLGAAIASLFNRRAGIVGGVMLALYAPAMFHDALIQKSVLDVFLVCLSLWLIAKLIAGGPAPSPSRPLWQRPSLLAAMLGATFGALALTRENAFVLAAVTLAWLVVDRRRDRTERVALPLAFAAALSVAIAPVAAHNWRITGGLYLTTAQFGTNFYIGNHAGATGTYVALREGRGDPAFERQDATELAQQALGRPLAPSEISIYWRDRAMQFIASSPAAWIQLLAKKALLLVSDTELIDTEAQESHAEWSLPLRLTGWVGRFGVLLPLAAFGLIATWELRPTRLILALAGAFAASVVLFFVVARYRLPLVPYLICFAAAGLTSLAATRTTPPRRRAIGVFALATAAVVAQWPTLPTSRMRAVTETNLGAAFQRERRNDDASHHYQRAIAIDAEYAPAYNNLGVALRELGRLDEAIAVYEQALRRQPEFAEGHFNLATALVERGRAAEALVHFQQAGSSVPATAVAHYNYGAAFAASGRYDRALAEYRAALDNAPDSALVRRALSDALARAGHYAEAATELRMLVMKEPDNPLNHYELGRVLLASGASGEAAEAFRATLRLSPDSADAHSDLGVALAADGRMSDAIAEFERALDLKPDHQAARRYLDIARRSVRQ